MFLFVIHEECSAIVYKFVINYITIDQAAAEKLCSFQLWVKMDTEEVALLFSASFLFKKVYFLRLYLYEYFQS